MSKFKIDKGQTFTVDKSVSKFRLGLGWDASASGKAIDIDAHVFGCVAGPKFYNDGSHAVTYANGDLQKNSNGSFQSVDGSIVHTGDNRTGAGDGDDESIIVDTSLLPQDITELSIFLTIHDARGRGQTFGDIQNAFVRLVDESTGQEVVRYDLKNEFAGVIGIQVGSIMRKGSDVWEFAAVGAGFNADLGEILGKLS